MTDTGTQNLLESAWWQGVKAVEGRFATRNWLNRNHPVQYDAVLAMGKAAGAMALGADDALEDGFTGLVITKYGHVTAELSRRPHLTVFESAHPTPDQSSLQSGQMAREFVQSRGSEDRLLVLISGGASALVENLMPHVELGDLQSINEFMHASGWDIGRMNSLRRSLSQVKGGRLLSTFSGRHIDVLAISDVPGDDISVIASGIGSPFLVKDELSPLPEQFAHLQRSVRNQEHDESSRYTHNVTIIGSNAVARAAAADFLTAQGRAIRCNAETLYADVFEVAATLAETLRQGPEGAYIWGGEPTVKLPQSPGQGGRNQSLAMAMACELGDQSDVAVLVAGTDGNDGPTDAAGALICPAELDLSDAPVYLQAANAYPWLKAQNALFISEPTGTNVMDLVVALKTAPP
ncbi:MAG: DUF4147 domain-containing protein [Pseudomonadota bacterium]